jgi:hypothetical protein
VKHLLVLGVFVTAIVTLWLLKAVPDHYGYASPFGPPSHFSFRGRDYLDPSRCIRPRLRDLPLRRVGSVPGFLTGAKPILRPGSLPRGLDPTYLYVRAGCLEAYDLSGGP